MWDYDKPDTMNHSYVEAKEKKMATSIHQPSMSPASPPEPDEQLSSSVSDKQVSHDKEKHSEFKQEIQSLQHPHLRLRQKMH
ncbi:hypothetical protein E2C01_011262 [Portunus trituberculatus]|uniref:Uncharacterized protein n=1 Tax=Portunus trituberculatus TaxID=210409 RepID=A0A5B7DAR6_PORTR|nr:hypothetical protein [Portunus trituberculatus]